MAAGDWDDPGPQLAVELGGEAAGGPTNIDDEYRWAGVEDPKVVITTSRDPSSKLKQFAKVRWSIVITTDVSVSSNFFIFFLLYDSCFVFVTSLILFQVSGECALDGIDGQRER